MIMVVNKPRGIETELPLLLWGLVETETWVGNWARAEKLAEQGCRAAEEAEALPGSPSCSGPRVWCGCAVAG